MYTNAHGKPDTNNENIPITLNFLFFSSDAVHGAGQIMCFLLCVCVSVTFVHSVNTNKDIFTFFYTIGPTPFQFFCTKRHGNIPTGTALTGASNAGGVDRNRDSEPICGFTACCEAFQQQVQYIQLRQASLSTVPIPRAQSFIISYYGFRFITAYN